MANDTQNQLSVADELGDDRKPSGRFVLKDRSGKVVAGPFDSSFEAECQRYLGIDNTRRAAFDQEG
ncbi:MAG: hypothetical protein WBI20_06800 [Burkholderiaceae bacterium]